MRRETGTFSSKQFFGREFLENTVRWHNFFMARIFSLQWGAVELKFRGTVPHAEARKF